MSHHDTNKGNASTTGKPDNWDREEMRPDEADPATPAPRDTKIPTWNEGQMAEEREDGSRAKGPSDEEIESSQHGLSGGGVNPGGGERWAERDKK
jgi:hypothetical protein